MYLSILANVVVIFLISVPGGSGDYIYITAPFYVFFLSQHFILPAMVFLQMMMITIIRSPFWIILTLSVLKFSLLDWQIQMDRHGKLVQMDLLDTLLLVGTMILFLIYSLKSKKFDKKTVSILVNSAVLTYCQIQYQCIVFLYLKDFKFTWTGYMTIFDLYYIPFFWIISVVIVNSRIVKKWLEKKAEEQESRKNGGQMSPTKRKTAIGETTVTNLSVA
ncbi:unnamed protein product [Caenorhabditis brenneri]